MIIKFCGRFVVSVRSNRNFLGKNEFFEFYASVCMPLCDLKKQVKSVEKGKNSDEERLSTVKNPLPQD